MIDQTYSVSHWRRVPYGPAIAGRISSVRSHLSPLCRRVSSTIANQLGRLLAATTLVSGVPLNNISQFCKRGSSVKHGPETMGETTLGRGSRDEARARRGQGGGAAGMRGRRSARDSARCGRAAYLDHQCRYRAHATYLYYVAYTNHGHTRLLSSPVRLEPQSTIVFAYRLYRYRGEGSACSPFKSVLINLKASRVGTYRQCRPRAALAFTSLCRTCTSDWLQTNLIAHRYLCTGYSCT